MKLGVKEMKKEYKKIKIDDIEVGFVLSHCWTESCLHQRVHSSIGYI